MLKNSYHIQGPSDPLIPGHLNFGDFILEKMWRFKDRTAMIDASTGESITYGEIVQQAMNFAVSLTRMGVRKGDVIGIMSENRNEYWGAVIGSACTGAAVNMIAYLYVKDELNHALSLTKPKFLITSSTVYKTHIDTLNCVPDLQKIIIFGDEIIQKTILYNDLAMKINNVKYEEFKSVDVAGQTDTLFILYSSGTTGLPKGVMLTHRNVLTACSLPPSHEHTSTTLSVSPWYHAMGLMVALREVVTGITGVYLPKYELELYLKTIEKYKISHITVVPPILLAICKRDFQYDLSSVRVVCSGAAPLHKATLQAIYDKFPNLLAILQGYGATEMTLGVIMFMATDKEIARSKPGSIGRVVPGLTIKVVDVETRKALGPNQRGEICAKGALLMKGYVGMGKEGIVDEEGFYLTGDVGYYDDEGYFYIVDRIKELIKYKAYQVPPAELEALLLTHASVKDVGVIGVPHHSSGEVPLAFVVVQDGAEVTEKELQEYVAERLSSPKHLRGGVRFVPAVPKSPSGKILRKELRQLYHAGTSKL